MNLKFALYGLFCLSLVKFLYGNQPNICNCMLGNEYFSYTNIILGKEFLFAIVWVIQKDQVKEMYESFFFVHMMVYKNTCCVWYLCHLYKWCRTTKDYVSQITQYCKWNICQCLQCLLSFIDSRRLDKDKMVGIVTNGALSIIGVHIGLVTHLKTYNLHLVLSHYISHKEALLVAYVSKDFHQFKLVDKLVKKDLEVLVHFLCI